jgi:protein TonB
MKNKILFIAILIFAVIAVKAQVPPPPPPPPFVADSNNYMPEFPGGLEAFQKYLRDSIQYPGIEKNKGIHGTVYVSFVVGKDGTITNVKVIREVQGAPGLSAEAIRVISNMPKWTPGKFQGRPVRTEMTQPIEFILH